MYGLNRWLAYVCSMAVYLFLHMECMHIRDWTKTQSTSYYIPVAG
jgi:hypothetical protein